MRLIPVHTGNTDLVTNYASWLSAHPRAYGEYPVGVHSNLV